LRYAALGAMFGFPALLCGATGLLSAAAQSLGVPERVIGWLALTGIALCVLIWCLSPFYIRLATRRRLRNLLSPALDERLRGAVGVRAWGWRHYVTASRTEPEGERVVDLRGI
jgi:hypothetical protein